ncbi:MAG: hypothetical protein AAB527_03775 [Patescibacteria group bacterium]
MSNKFLNQGFGLLEIIISAALISSSLFSLAYMTKVALRATTESFLNAKASYLAEEALEAARFIRDKGWSANIDPLISGSVYYPVFLAGGWVASTTSPALIDGIFGRQMVFEDVYRSIANSNIVPADSGEPKVLDPDTIKVTAAVSRLKGSGTASSSVELITYITNLFKD